jgi:branched-chain amino acid transport system ATP-binding protein
VRILEANAVSKNFGGVQAVADLSLAVEGGQIFGIIGPNGSGKTTFFNVLTGIYPPTAGAFNFKGRDITRLPADEIARLGIARTFQNIRLFRNMSVLDNVLIGEHPRLKLKLWDALFQTAAKRRVEREARVKAQDLLRFVDLEEKAGEFAANLAYGEQRRVELARALGNQPTLVLLDEPTAGMSDGEAAEIMQLIQKIRQKGVTILLIEHNMKVMMGTAEWIVAMDAGRKIAEGTPQEIQHNEAVIRAYLGEEE